MELYKYLIDLIKTLPTWLQLFAIGSILGVGYLARNKEARNAVVILLKRYIFQANRRAFSTDDVFVRYKRYLKDVQYYNFGNRTKDFLFKGLLELKINVVIKHLKEFIKEKDTLNMGRQALHAKCLDLVAVMVQEYESEFKIMVTKKYGLSTVTDELSNYVLDIFSKYHQVNIDALYSQLEAISTSDFLRNNYHRVSYFIFQIHVALRNGIIDAEKAFKHLNGKLEELESKLKK